MPDLFLRCTYVRTRLQGIAVCAIVFLVLTASGCTRETPPSETSGPVVHLTYWPATNQQEVRLADTIVQRWNRTHPRIQVFMQPIPASQSSEEVLLAAIAGKTTPDVCSNIWPGSLREYTEAGGLVRLDQFADFDSVALSRSSHALLDIFKSSDGHAYQMPWKTNPVMMYYNTTMLENSGSSAPPRIYSDYLAMGRKIAFRADGVTPTGIWMGERDIRPIWWQRWFDFYTFYIAATDGQTLFSNSDVSFGNAQAEEVMGFFQQCYSTQIFPRTYFQGGDLFILGKKATNFAGPYMVAALKKFSPQLRYGIAPLPVPDTHTGPVYTYGDFKNIAIFSTTTHPKEAWEFVKYLVSTEHDALLLDYCDQLPIRSDVATNPAFKRYFEAKPEMLMFAHQVPYTRSMDDARDLKEIFDAISQEYEACAVYGKKTPAEAVSDAVRRARSIVEWNK
ncbi:MAG TPA: extracellular solute-binding protein [Bacteroidota bacterium]|nr:extracellular solute-binding protein [Bacteroidota bacterium]